jgi:FkbM family methyltransferase
MSSLFEELLILYARRFPVRRGKLRIVDALWRATTGRNGSHRFAILKYGGFKVQCDLNQMLQRQFYFFGTYLLEENVLRCWMDAAADAKVVFDVGANAGIYSLAALATQPSAAVHAFEPTPEIAVQLRADAQLNGLNRLHVHEAAVFKSDGYATLKRCRGQLESNEGMNFISTDMNGPGERVKTISLDRFCQEHSIQHVDLIKLDVQGQEHSVLQGAQQLIKSRRLQTIFMELNWSRQQHGPCPASDSIQLLDRAGYWFSKPGKRLDWEKAGDWLHSLSDVVARCAIL